MSVVHLELRADVLEAIAHELQGPESFANVIEDAAYWEAASRKRSWAHVTTNRPPSTAR